MAKTWKLYWTSSKCGDKCSLYWLEKKKKNQDLLMQSTPEINFTPPPLLPSTPTFLKASIRWSCLPPSSSSASAWAHSNDFYNLERWNFKLLFYSVRFPPPSLELSAALAHIAMAYTTVRELKNKFYLLILPIRTCLTWLRGLYLGSSKILILTQMA